MSEAAIMIENRAPFAVASAAGRARVAVALLTY